MLLREIGEALYGHQWQSDLARALSVNVRTVQRWAAGEVVTPVGVYCELLDTVRQRQAAIGELLPRLEEACAVIERERPA